MKKYLIFLLFICGCNKAVPEAQVIVSGITERDANGSLIGQIDRTDWLNDEKWIEQEATLFPGMTLDVLNNVEMDQEDKEMVLGAIKGKVSYLAYPNPCSAELTLDVRASFNPEYYTVVIVSEELDVIKRTTYAEFVNLRLKMNEDPDYVKGSLYRVYYIYKLYDYPFIFKGHGDLSYL